MVGLSLGDYACLNPPGIDDPLRCYVTTGNHGLFFSNQEDFVLFACFLHVGEPF